MFRLYCLLGKMIHSASFFCLCFLLSNGVFGADRDEMKSVSVMERDSVSLNTDVKVQREDQILWMFGPQERRIAEIYKQEIHIDANPTFEKRLQMDDQTGSLTIRNITNEQSGLYTLQIINNIGNTCKRFNVTVFALNERSRHTKSVAVIVLLLVIAVVAGLLYHKKCKKTEKEVQTQDGDIQYADLKFSAQPFQNTDKTFSHTEYSRVNF